MKRTLLSILLLTLAAPLFAEQLKFTVVGIDCEACSKPIIKALAGVPGVANAKLDWKAGSATVDVPAGFERESVRKALTNLGFEAIFPGEKRKDIEALPADVLKTLDIVTDTKGNKVDVAATLAPGKITVIDFYADWCGPCSVLEVRLHHYMQAHPNVALRRVNIGKWDTPAAAQATREFRAEALPYIRVYNGKGKYVGTVTGGMWDEVLAILEKAEK
jgi:copper chaperone CopZ